MKLLDKFAFGKYKGISLYKVLEEHGSYVNWCLENVDGFHIEPEAIENDFKTKFKEWKASRERAELTYSSERVVRCNFRSDSFDNIVGSFARDMFGDEDYCGFGACELGVDTMFIL